MVDADDGPPLESRPPRLNDLVSLCRRLNEEQARYIVVGYRDGAILRLPK